MKKIVVLLCLIFLVSACRQPIPKAPIKEQKQAKKEAEEQVEEYPNHIAPPPAYGNKVVMK